METLKASDLRIGNWVSPIYPNYLSASVINAHSFVDILRDESIVSGIPLTEEWLLAFGFEKGEYGNYYFKFKNLVGDCTTLVVFPPENIWNDKRRVEEGIYGIRLVSQILDSVALSSIRYVHSLQNVFHAVTETELDLSKTQHA